MAIVGYSGLPGSGKSYGVVENVVLPALKKGRHIITNIPLKTGRLSDDFPDGRVTIFTNKDVQDNQKFFSLDEHPSGVIWIIDEAWRYWRSGQKSTNIPEHEKSFFTEHRHCVGEDGMTNEIVLVTQDLSQLCSFVRSLIEETFKATKMTAIGKSNYYKIAVYSGAVSGQRNGNAIRNLAPKKYSSDVYQYYKSHTKNKTDFAAGMEEKIDDRGNILKRPLFKIFIPFAVLVCFFSVRNVYSYFNPSDELELNSDNEKSAVVSSVQISKTDRISPDSSSHNIDPNDLQTLSELQRGWLPISDSWRIVGRINDSFMIWGERGSRVIPASRCGKLLSTAEDYCVIDNSLVTYFSYIQPEEPRSQRVDFDLDSSVL
jgi:zona occludens toxin